MSEPPKPTEIRAAKLALLAVAFDATAPFVALPPVASTTLAVAQAASTIWSAVFGKNTAEAAEEADRTLRETPGAEETILALREHPELWLSRQTLAYRLIMEAGRHPDRVMRLALGRAAARMILSDIDSLDAFERVEALERMTALDYAVLEHARAGLDVPLSESEMWTKQNLKRRPKGWSRATAQWIAVRLPADFTSLPLARIKDVAARLERLGAAERTSWRFTPEEVNEGLANQITEDSWRSTPFGEKLLQITAPPGVVIATPPAADGRGGPGAPA